MKKALPPEIKTWLDEQARLKRPQGEVALDLLKKLHPGIFVDAQSEFSPWAADEVKWAVNVYESARQRERARLRKLSPTDHPREIPSVAVVPDDLVVQQVPFTSTSSGMLMVDEPAKDRAQEAQEAQEATSSTTGDLSTPPDSSAPSAAPQTRSDSASGDTVPEARAEQDRRDPRTSENSRLEQVLAEGLAMHTDMARKVYEAILALYNSQKTTDELLRMLATSTQQADLLAAKDAEIETLKEYVAHLQRQVGAA
jgi:hypothetical protein